MPIEMSAARSRIPFSPHRAAKRIDPFHDYVWSRGSTAQWRSRRKMEARAAAGLGRISPWFLPGEQLRDDAKVRLFRNRTAARLGVLGAIDSWRTLTLEQASAILGTMSPMTSRAALTRDLYALDLVDVGHTLGFSDRQSDADDTREWLVRPARSAAFSRDVQPSLTYPELVKITGGREWLTGGQYDRHNILATEFALRIAEFTKAATVLGERWSDAPELLFSEWGMQTPYPQLSNRGDVTVVRRDGLRVVVEMTASAQTDQLVRKVSRWAQQMSVAPLSRQGTVVLFLVCGEQHPKPGDTDALRRKVQQAIVQAVRMYPGTAGNLISERIAVASWSDLFPGRHLLHDDFQRLPVWLPRNLVGVSGMDQVWEETFLFDEALFPYQPSSSSVDPLAVAGNSTALFGVPHWIRDERQPPQIATDAVRTRWGGSLPGLTAEDVARMSKMGKVQLPDRLRL